MPFENPTHLSRSIAIVGGGISGMAAAHLLARYHRVTLFEAGPRLGGHARTVIAGKNGDQPVDTGFIVYNNVNYPNLVALFQELNVPVVKSDMSFGASINGGALEFSLSSLKGVFAQKRNLFNPSYLQMLRDIVYFNKHGAAAASDPTLTIGDYLEKLNTGAWFCDYYILPLSGAIWSTPVQGILDFPAQAMINFFQNHNLMQVSGQHQWYTISGGSIEYVKRLSNALQKAGVEIRLSCPIKAVRRTDAGAQMRALGGTWEAFDDVIFATHADDSLALLQDKSSAEAAALSAVRYQTNDIVLHADARLMPKRKAAWSSWVYCQPEGQRPERIDLTYWMNNLQAIPQEDPLFVTLNPNQPIDDALIYDISSFRHPVYDMAALEAQGKVRAMNGARNTWFCGAWMRHGFHEDGFASALEVAQHLLARHSVAL
jgi:predicted NAD/FAD-binding protein